MSADTQQLIQQSLQGDQRAFGQIVERYQGAVSAMAYSVTGNLAQSEDLAQEAFIIAWKKLGALQKHESLSAWLCGIARNLARDWMRTQAARPTISMEHLDETAQPLGESPEATQQRRERADLVWSALAEIPENYREPLILFYRQGESIRDIAEALELTEDNVKQRLSRGRKLLRAEVARTVEDTLADTRPGKAFTAGVIAALPALYGAKAGAAEVASTSAKAVAGPAAMGALMKIALPVAAVVGMVLGVAWWGPGLGSSDSDKAPGTEAANQAADTRGQGGSDGAATLQETTAPPASFATFTSETNAVAADKSGGTISGIVLIRGTDEPAPGMRVVYGRQDVGLTETLTDEAGRFLFKGVPAGDYAVLAYDAGYGEMPEDDYRSEHYLATMRAGETTPELRIEVPPSGIVLTGRITDTATGTPLPDLGVTVIGKADRQPAPGKSDAHGRYRILGLQAGQWRVYLNNNNPLFSSDYIKDMQTILIEGQTGVTLDFAIDRGVPIGGVVVDATGRPVSDATVWAKLYPTGGIELHCNFKAAQSGEFTIWGARPGDTATLSAVKDQLLSHMAVVTPELGKDTEKVTLVLLPRTTVSGRFEDEDGRPVAADLWSRAYHPGVPGGWQGRTEDATTFTAEFTQGEHELQGRADGKQPMGEVTQRLMVGAEPVAGVVVKVTALADAGAYAISGRVVDEQGQPLRECRVYMNSDSRDTKSYYQETHTDLNGLFQFDGLDDGSYRIHAVPGIALYEDFSGYEKLNPLENPEIVIVAHRAPALRGRVTDAESGEPVTAFDVNCGESDMHGRENSWGPESPSLHSESGEFSIPARLDLDWYLRVSARGYAPQRVTGGPLASGEQSELIEFKLAPSRVVRGTVADSKGNAVPRAFVFLNGKFIDGAMRYSEGAAAETDSDGRFTVDSIPADAEHLYFWKKGYAALRAPIAEEMHAVLHEGGVIEGRITVNGDLPQGELTVIASAPDTDDTIFAKIAADASYRMEHLMDASYRFQITIQPPDGPGRYFTPDERIEARHDGTVTHDIDVPSGAGVLEGKVLDGGVPAAGVQVHCRNGDTSIYASSGESGEYRFDQLIAGSVKLGVYVPIGDSDATEYREVAELEISADELVQQDIELSR